MPDFSRSQYNSLWDDHIEVQTKQNPPMLSKWQQKDEPALSRTLPDPSKPFDHRPKPEGSFTSPYEEPYISSRTPSIPVPYQQQHHQQQQCHTSSSISSSLGQPHWQHYPTTTMIQSGHAAPPLSSSSSVSTMSTSPYPESTSSPTYNPSYYPREDDIHTRAAGPMPIRGQAPHTSQDMHNRISKYTAAPPHHIQGYQQSPSTPPLSSSGSSHYLPGQQRLHMTPKSAKSEKERGRREKHNRAIERLRKLLPGSLAAATKTDVVEAGSEHIRSLNRDVDAVRELVLGILAAAESSPATSGEGMTVTLGRGVSQDEVRALRGLIGRPKRGSS
ncbi:MAG: hypothetical protein M4579_006828 [Chaenotheca gracillima]|nr:MAG: hypothetical protein M4579_006828 [Chaenotheca gracillima]